MLLNKKVSNGKGFAKKEAYEYEGKQYEPDIKNGDIVTILNAGSENQNQFGEDTVEFVIKTRNGEKNMAFNQSSINVLIDAYGKDTAQWVGKEAKVLTKKGVFAGKKGIAAYVVTQDYELNDFGEITKSTAAASAGADEADDFLPEDEPAA